MAMPRSMSERVRGANLRGTAWSGERSPRSIIFLVALWFCLFIAFATLVVLIVTTWLDGQGMMSTNLFTNYPGPRAEQAGMRPAILGSIWVIVATAAITLPLGISAAIYLEELADRTRWFNRLVELNVQNLAGVPSIVYGLLTLGVLTLIAAPNKNVVIGGAIALGMLVLPVVIISTREALRAVPREIRDGSLALGATPLQTIWRNTLPASVPGIATGTILALSRAFGEAAPLLVLGALVFVRFDPDGLLSQFTTMPIQIFNWTSRPQAAFHELAAAGSILLLVLLLAMNAVAILIRNKYQKRW